MAASTMLRTTVLLVRHGATPTTGLVLPGRAPGLHLADTGVAQAERVAGRLAEVGVDALYTSPMERAVETAAPTASALGLDARVEDGLTECDFGSWTGEKLADLAVLPAWQDVQRTPSTFRFPGGESFVELQERLVGAIERVRDRHAGGVVACFSHADPIKVALAHALGTPLDHFQRLHVGPGSVSAIVFADGQPPTVPVVNSTHDPLVGLGG